MFSPLDSAVSIEVQRQKPGWTYRVCASHKFVSAVFCALEVFLWIPWGGSG